MLQQNGRSIIGSQYLEYHQVIKQASALTTYHYVSSQLVPVKMFMTSQALSFLDIVSLFTD